MKYEKEGIKAEEIDLTKLEKTKVDKEKEVDVSLDLEIDEEVLKRARGEEKTGIKEKKKEPFWSRILGFIMDGI